MLYFQFFVLDSREYAALLQYVRDNYTFNSLYWIQDNDLMIKVYESKTAFNSLYWIPKRGSCDILREQQALSILCIGFKIRN